MKHAQDSSPSASPSDPVLSRLLAERKEHFRKVFGIDSPFQKTYHADELIHFAPLRTMSREEEQRLRAEVERLAPFFQGPFPCTRNLAITGAYDGRPKCRQILNPMLPQSLAGKRVLEIACNAGFDSFFINLRGPREYLATDPDPICHQQALLLNSVYRTGIEFRRLAWQELSSAVHGTFDLVVCIGLLYHEPSPMELLAKMEQLTAPGGAVILETLVLATEVRAPLAKFIETTYRGDPSVWWIPTTTCVEGLVRAAGFSEVQLTHKMLDASLNPLDPTRTIEGWPSEALAYFLAQKKEGRPATSLKPAELAATSEWEAQLGGARAVQQPDDAASYRRQLEQTRAQLEAIYATLHTSLSWRFANRVGRMANRLCPPGSWRGRVYAAVASRLRGERRGARVEPRG